MKLVCVFVLIFFIPILSSWTVSALSRFNVLDYGATGNGKTDDSQAFLKAWGAVCEATEGIPTLYVPLAKSYLLKPLTFEGPCKSKQIHLHLRGTVIAPRKGAWPSDKKDKWIQFYDIDGLTIDGGGKIDGQGSSWWKGCDDHCTRPTALFFHNCNGLRLSHMKHVDSGRNHISLNVCNNVIFSNIYIKAPNESPNTDGIDISKSTNVLIQNSFIATGDDCVAINNGSSSINIVGVTCGPGHGISIGSLGKDRQYNVVENIYVSNCFFKGTQNGVRIKTWEGGYGYARNITFEKITLLSTKNPIIIDQHYNALASSRKNKANSIKVSDVTYREVYGTSANENAIILNCSRTGCTNIVLKDVHIKPSTPGEEAKAFCQNVEGKAEFSVPHVPCLSKSY